ncbi:MAG: hypothetical protein IH849_12030, partial [Acidobacteria bacterium]|nr:hypothetical protein [Acidobacteriota bacterium]
IRKKLGFTESTRFNLERGERDKLKGGETDALLGGKNGIGPRWKKLLCAFSLRQLLRGYISTKRTTERILQVLSDEFPRLRSRIGPEAKRQLATVGGNLRFQKAMYGERVVPRMLRLLAERSEYDGIWDLLPAVERRGG